MCVWAYLLKCVAVTPAEAAESLIQFVDKFNMGMTGEYWAPRGSGYGNPWNQHAHTD